MDLLHFLANSTPEELEGWKEMEQESHMNRLTHPEAMDIYVINPGQAAFTRSTLQISLLEDKDQMAARKGETTWLALGLKLEEAQYVIPLLDCFHSKKPKIGTQDLYMPAGPCFVNSQEAPDNNKTANP